MEEEDRVSMCVITIYRTVSGSRSAVVTQRTDVTDGLLAEKRALARSSCEVVEQVTDFLTAVGMPAG